MVTTCCEISPFWAWLKHWLPCGVRGKSVSRCIGSEVYCFIVPFYKEVEYEGDLSALVYRLDWQSLPKLVHGLSSCVVRLVTCISPTVSNTGRVTVTSRFIFVVMRGGYSLTAIKSS